MANFNRRHFLSGAGAATAGLTLPRFAIAQADTRPTVTYAVSAITTAATLEILRERSNAADRTLSTVHENLIGKNLQGRMEQTPELATSWKRIDAKTIEFTLRQGVKFHNGDEMTAEDVVFTFGPERMFGSGAATNRQLFATAVARASIETKALPAEVPAAAARLFPTLDRVEIVDKYTVRFITKTPDLTLEGRLGGSGAFIISRRAFEEAKTWAEWARKPVSTGPYKVREFRPDQLLVLDAHEDYWGGRPPIKTLRFIQVSEPSARINGLLSGEFDFISDVPPDQIVSIEKNPKFEVQGGAINNHRVTVFDKHHPQLVDPRVRQAITHSIDRQAIVDSLWSGKTVVPNGLQFDFYGPMVIEGWKAPEYNPARARELLKAANYKGDPIPFRVLNNYYPQQVANAQILAEMYKAVGLNVEIQMRENWQQIWENDGKRALRDWSNTAGFDDPSPSLSNFGPTGQDQQAGEWINAEMNQLYNQFDAEGDFAKRKAMFKRMLEICEREDPAYNVLHQSATFTGKRKDIAWKQAPSFGIDFRSKNFSMRS